MQKRKKDGYTIQMTPKKKARKAVKAKIWDIIRSGGATPVAMIVARVDLLGWISADIRTSGDRKARQKPTDRGRMKNAMRLLILHQRTCGFSARARCR